MNTKTYLDDGTKYRLQSDIDLVYGSGSAETKTETGLLPCPFAHDPKKVERPPSVTSHFNEDGYWQVVCPNCLASTACCEKKERAKAAWNARATADIEAKFREAIQHVIENGSSRPFIDDVISRLRENGAI